MFSISTCYLNKLTKEPLCLTNSETFVFERRNTLSIYIFIYVCIIC